MKYEYWMQHVHFIKDKLSACQLTIADDADILSLYDDSVIYKILKAT